METLKVWEVEAPRVTQRGNDPLERNGTRVRPAGPPPRPDTVLSDAEGGVREQGTPRRQETCVEKSSLFPYSQCYNQCSSEHSPLFPLWLRERQTDSLR